ncbi:uncharacterized protein LOC123922948 [Trifolium pratense]|uniref:uncharacterized protein LOC123922948 n=1 Tax=Trifolium pratense TaxID=57577 RepID=UPI001E690B1B|nr:uncharacterized protein LOC123922948 [Trifolium pratense]
MFDESLPSPLLWPGLIPSFFLLRLVTPLSSQFHLSSAFVGVSLPGLVLRRPDGSAVGAATRVHNGVADAATGEAMGLNDAMDWVEKLGEHKVIFELDSQIIVKAVKEKAMIRKGWGCVTRRCKRFLEVNPEANIRWVPRAANKAAHELAKWADHEPNREWLNTTPPCIWSLIQKDKSLIVFP